MIKKALGTKFLKKENKKQQIIPYEYILDNSQDSVSKDLAKELADDDKEMEQMFGSSSNVF